MTIKESYIKLLNHFGPQNWWPSFAEGYGRAQPSSAKASKGKPIVASREEMMIGAILTQNTAWKNVEKALSNLNKNDALNFKTIEQTPIEQLEVLIRSSGFYRQKAERLKNLVQYFQKEWGNDFDRFFAQDTFNARTRLLKLNGIGRETADSILLYAGNKLIFVIDTYTRRLAKTIGLSQYDHDYDILRAVFESELDQDVFIYQEFHALIVAWGKQETNLLY